MLPGGADAYPAYVRGRYFIGASAYPAYAFATLWPGSGRRAFISANASREQNVILKTDVFHRSSIIVNAVVHGFPWCTPLATGVTLSVVVV